MAFCKNCGKELEEAAKFCEGCGTATNGSAHGNAKTGDVAQAQNQEVQAKEKMSLWQAYISFWKNYANFKGKATRMEFWGACLINTVIAVIALVAGMSLVLVGGTFIAILCVLSSIYSIVAVIPSITLSIRRLHDVNISAGNLFWALVPIWGQIKILIWFCEKSVFCEDDFKDKKISVIIIALCALWVVFVSIMEIVQVIQLAQSINAVAANFYEKHMEESRVKYIKQGVFVGVDMESDFVYSGLLVNGKIEWFVGDIPELLNMPESKINLKTVKITVQEDENPYDEGTTMKSITNVELVN